MARADVSWSEAAKDDLLGIYDFIASQGSPLTAFAYYERIEARCLGIGDQPRSGKLRPDIAPGVRSIPFEGVVIYYGDERRVLILRIIHAARDQAKAFGHPSGA